MFDVAMRVAQAATPPKVVQQAAVSFQNVLQNAKAQADPAPPEVIKQTQEFIDTYDTAKYDRRLGENVKDGKLDAKELANGLAGAPPNSTPPAQNLQAAGDMIAKYNTPGDTDRALDVNELSVAVVDDLKQQAGNDGGPAKGDNGGGGSGGGGGGASGSSGAGQSGGIWALLAALIDTDHDGKISKEEAEAFAKKYGGTVDAAELAKALKEKAAELGQSAPSDADISEFFNKADTHKSNDLDIAELTALKKPQQDAAA